MAQVLPDILQDVNECVADLEGRLQRAGMKSIRPNLSAPAERTVDRLGDADGEPLDTTAEGDEPVAFDEQMDVIALHAEVHDPESFS